VTLDKRVEIFTGLEGLEFIEFASIDLLGIEGNGGQGRDSGEEGKGDLSRNVDHLELLKGRLVKIERDLLGCVQREI
jgi:hypothetical protein